MTSLVHDDGALAPPRSPTTTTIRLALALMALSGAAGLGWQMLWTAQFGAALGHELAAVLAVVAAFFGGLALGAQVLGRPIAASRFPGRWYVACEALICAWGLALTLALPTLTAAWAVLAGEQPAPAWHWTLAFAGPFLFLLPATAAMGATLPAIERLVAGAKARPEQFAGLYAANTVGAVAGTLLCVTVAVPWLGLARTGWLCSLLNAVCAIAACAWWQQVVAPDRTAQPLATVGSVRPLVVLASTGVLGIGYEVLAIRVLSQVTENTVYSFAIVLAVYLLGTAAGAAIYQRARARCADAVRVEADLLSALAGSVLAGGAALWWADALCAWPANGFGVGIGSALTGEALAALAALTLPTAVMGAAFSHLCLRAQAAGWRLGSAVAVNTLGAAIAPPLIGVVLLPALGAKWVIVGIALGYLALLPALKRRGVQAWLPAALALGLAGLGTELRFIDVEPGGRVLSHRDGAMAAVSVVEDADSVAHLRINNREQEGSSASGLADARLAYLPLLLHPAPRRALFLGLGTGVTAAAAAEDADLSVDVVELLPEVIAAAADFPRGADSPQPAHPLRILAGDARRFVRAAGPRYDLVVADLFHPARSGSGALYTVEHFEAVRERLAPGGLFCQWLALHQMDLATLRSIVAAFIRAYPGAVAVLASNSLATPVIGLIAHPDRQRFDAAAVRQRLAAPQGAARRAELGFSDEFAVLGSLVAGPAALARFAAGAPANTDDRPLVAHRAPLATYAPEAAPAQRLIDLLAGFQTDTESLATPPPTLSDDAVLVWRQRLAAYRAARQRFIEIGVGVRPDADPARMLAQVEQPLLGVLRQSADFRPALDPLLAMAVAVAATEPLHARRLLGDLIALRPDRTDLTQALRRLP